MYFRPTDPTSNFGAFDGKPTYFCLTILTGDSFTYHDQMKFSTRDRDNGRWQYARLAQGAWWFGIGSMKCHLNGRYFKLVCTTYYLPFYYAANFNKIIFFSMHLSLWMNVILDIICRAHRPRRAVRKGKIYVSSRIRTSNLLPHLNDNPAP